MIVLKVPSPSTREVILHIKEPSPSGREVSVQLKEPFMGEGGILAVGHGEDTIKGIFPKRPEKM